jgi:hypothetical protein
VTEAEARAALRAFVAVGNLELWVLSALAPNLTARAA